MRQLLWKETRESGLIWIIFALVILATVYIAYYFEFLTYGCEFRRPETILYTIIWILAALFFPAFSLAGEREKQTLHYLEGLPVTPVQIWLAKALYSTLALLLLFLLTVLLKTIFTGSLWLSLGLENLGFAFSLSLVFLSLSLFCSTVLTGTTTAAAGAVALGFTIFAVGAFFV